MAARIEGHIQQAVQEALSKNSVSREHGDLPHPRQTGMLAEFNVRFDEWAAKVDLTEACLVKIYVEGLVEEIANSVKRFNPWNLIMARRLANIQDWSIRKRREWQDGRNAGRQLLESEKDKLRRELIHLRQSATLKEYNERFDQLSTEAGLSEECLLELYIGGLQEEIADSVLLFDPRNLLEARRLARVQEISLNRRALREAKRKPAVGATPSSYKTTFEEVRAVAATTNLILVPAITEEPEIQENEATPAVQIIPAPETSEEKGEGDGDASSGQASCSFADVGSSPTSSPPSEVPSGFVVAVPSSDVGEDAGTVINTNGTWEFDLVAEFPDAGSPIDKSTVPAIARKKHPENVQKQWKGQKHKGRPLYWKVTDGYMGSGRNSNEKTQKLWVQYVQWVFGRTLPHDDRFPMLTMSMVWFKGCLVNMLMGPSLIHCVLYLAEGNIQWTIGCGSALYKDDRKQAIYCTWQDPKDQPLKMKGYLEDPVDFVFQQWYLEGPLGLTESYGHMEFFLHQRGPTSESEWKQLKEPADTAWGCDFLIHVSPTRCLAHIWYRGDLVRMLGSGPFQFSVDSVLVYKW